MACVALFAVFGLAPYRCIIFEHMLMVLSALAFSSLIMVQKSPI